MTNNPAAANRVAITIATFKWVVIGLIALSSVVFFLVSLVSGEASLVAVGFVGILGGAVYAAIAYVMFGWYEQSLRMLADISQFTGMMAGGRAPAPQGGVAAQHSSSIPPPYGS